MGRCQNRNSVIFTLSDYVVIHGTLELQCFLDTIRDNLLVLSWQIQDTSRISWLKSKFSVYGRKQIRIFWFKQKSYIAGSN